MSAPSRPVRIWDLPVRLFHWGTVALIPVLWITERENWMEMHVQAGLVLLGLVIFRLLWGLFGSAPARFARFLRPPREAIFHLREMFHPEPDDSPGHNPAGGWMVALLLALLLGESVIGVFVNNEVADEGPLSAALPAWVLNLATDLHWWLFLVLLGAVALHLTAIAAYRVLKGQNLVLPMLTGRKTLPVSVPPPAIAGLARAIPSAALAAAGAWALDRFL
ncbi:MAG: cytochrome b/b6 domain-containing protein [Rhodospirillales bacterium]|nr:cytochrome b/b6 domain-containing protein [Rhodospirillales bacterium]